jgi:hypothetical protein
MRFMILVKANKDSEAGVMPTEELLKTMADYHEQLAKAGVLLDGNGLQASSKGWRFTWSGGKKTYTDGPFTEVKERQMFELEDFTQGESIERFREMEVGVKK